MEEELPKLAKFKLDGHYGPWIARFYISHQEILDAVNELNKLITSEEVITRPKLDIEE